MRRSPLPIIAVLALVVTMFVLPTPVAAQQPTAEKPAVAQLGAPSDASKVKPELTDFSDLAGTYHGTAYTPQGQAMKQRVTREVKADGSYKSYGYVMIVGELARAENGEILYQDSASSGIVEVIRKDGKISGLKFWRDKDRRNMATDLER